MQIRVRLDELVSTKAAARQLPRELERLERGDVDQLVLTTHNAPRAVLLTVSRYEELLAAAGQRELDVPPLAA